MALWNGLEGTLKIIRFHPPCHGQGHVPLEQDDQSPMQAGLDSTLLTSTDIASVALENLPLHTDIGTGSKRVIECLVVYIKKPATTAKLFKGWELY